MSKRTIIIKIAKDRVFFNPVFSVPFSQTNIPYQHLSFRTHSEIYWTAEMLEYNNGDQSLKVKIADYFPVNHSGFSTQTPKKEVSRLLFEKFDWPKLETFLTSYQRIKLLEILDNLDENPFAFNPEDEFVEFEHLINTSPAFPKEVKQPELVQPQIKKSITETYTENFRVDFADAVFNFGYVSFKKIPDCTGRETDFKIINEHIIPEFDNIKFWFARKLKTRNFKVIATITLTDGKLEKATAVSPQINRINPQMIDSIKFQRTMALTSPPRIELPDKSLFTADDIFGCFDDEGSRLNAFNQSEDDILQLLIENTNIRNRQQLAYLAGKKQSEKYKLRYTLNPHFGFLFFVEGNACNHFVWELLNSHATYIWSIEKATSGIESQYKVIEEIINTIRVAGRDKYRQAYRGQHTLEDIDFHFIEHENIASKLIDSFPKWKQRLEELLE